MPSAAVSTVLRGRPDHFPGATFGADFTRGRYKLGKKQYRAPTSIPGFTFTRASTGYAETAAGALVAFASGEPRITDKGLLVEEARTTLALGSVLTGGTLFPTNWAGAINNGSSRGPVASTTGAPGAWEAAAVNQREYFQQTITLAANSTYTVSVYVEEVTGTTRTLSYCSNLPAGATSGAILNPPTPGLYTYQVVTAATAGTCVLRLGIDTAGDLNANCTVRFSRVNFELGAFPTSYIPTTTASATRAADDAALSATLPATPTLVARVLWADLTTTRTALSWNDGTVSNRVELYVSNAEAGSVFAASGGATQINAGAATTGGRAKIAVTFDGADYRGSANGGTITAATGKIAPVGANSLNIGRFNATQYFNNYIERIIGYPLPQTQAQLNALTT